ncbi:MAG: type IV pilus assembly protein PilM [Candidatus Aminicenantes bacterium]|nr:type IV pilus assembly protein PilM [Candidatus Aminicenantes bacterium]
MLGLKREKTIVGLDIGSHGVKVLELDLKSKGKKDAFEVARIGYEPLPHDAIVEGSIIDSAAVAETIAAAFDKAKISSKDVALSVSGNSVIIKKISLPAMETQELAESIIWEAKHNIPYPYEETHVDYAILKPPPGSDERGLEILLVAVKKEKVSAYANVINQARRNLVAIEVDAFALYNAFEINYPEEFEEKTVALVGMGANVTTIVVADHGVPQLFRDLTLGGSYITEAIRKDLNIGYPEAESLLRGVPPAGIAQADAESLLDMNIKELLDEIEKTLAFFTAEDRQEKKINQIYLCGGLAGITNLPAAFEQKFRVPATLFNPFRKVRYNEKKLDPVYDQEMGALFGVACGLATRKRER